MANVRQTSFSKRNLIWAIIVLLAIFVGAAVGGWKLAVPAGIIALAASEIVERAARNKRD